MKALFLRDVRLAFRLGGGAGQSLGFFLIAVSLIAFGVGPEPEKLAAVAPGALWVFAMLACLLSLDRFLFVAKVYVLLLSLLSEFSWRQSPVENC